MCFSGCGAGAPSPCIGGSPGHDRNEASRCDHLVLAFECFTYIAPPVLLVEPQPIEPPAQGETRDERKARAPAGGRVLPARPHLAKSSSSASTFTLVDNRAASMMALSVGSSGASAATDSMAPCRACSSSRKLSIAHHPTHRERMHSALQRCARLCSATSSNACGPALPASSRCASR